MKTVKAGDKVRVIGNASGHAFTIGEIVENINGTDLFNGEGGKWFMGPVDYTLVLDTKFKIGDICRIVGRETGTTKKYHYFGIGDIVKVINIPKAPADSYWVHEVNGLLGQYVKPYHMELVVDKEETEPKIKDKEIKNNIKIDTDVLGMADIIHIGDITIALPTGCPIGISRKHPDDENVKEVGQSLAFTRLLKSAKAKGVI